MKKQEAIKTIKHIDTLTINDRIVGQQVDMVIKNQVLEIINQIDEPKTPVIPKFVAEWIRYCKSNKLTLLGAFDPVSENGIGLANTFTGEVWKGVDWAKRNQDIFACAWLFGYEVEKEKLYTVEIPNPNRKGDNRFFLHKDPKTGKILLCKGNFNKNKNKNLWLNESEIRKDFEWVWQAGFAKEVED
uniref:DUF1642 domain-containing protein n=1 Tax=Streptococcus pluranimalium TaxID=82348 RepID=UPI003F693F15